MSDRPLTDRSLFRHWSQEICRYGDTDRQGHVNNAVFSTFFETGRVFLMERGPQLLVPDGMEVVIVRVAIDYRAEMQWGDMIDIGTGSLRIGNTSFTTGQGLFRGDRCVASAEAVLVMLDSKLRRPVPLPPVMRARLSEIAL